MNGSAEAAAGDRCVSFFGHCGWFAQVLGEFLRYREIVLFYGVWAAKFATSVSHSLPVSRAPAKVPRNGTDPSFSWVRWLCDNNRVFSDNYYQIPVEDSSHDVALELITTSGCYRIRDQESHLA